MEIHKEGESENDKRERKINKDSKKNTDKKETTK